MTTFVIKRGSFWQDGKQRYANHPDPSLRTVSLADIERDAMDPNHTDLQSADEAALEAKKLQAESELKVKQAEALAKIDAEHKAALEAKKKGGGK